MRAPTPTAAAHLVVPDQAELRRRIGETAAALESAMGSAIAVNRRHLAHLGLRVRDPRNPLRQARQRLDEAAAELDEAMRARVVDIRRRLRELAQRMQSPLARTRERRLLLTRLAIGLARAMSAGMTPYRTRLTEASAALGASSPQAAIAEHRMGLASLDRRMGDAARTIVGRARLELSGAAGRLDAISPLRVLERGYAVALHPVTGRAVTDAAEVNIGDDLEIRLSRGRLRARTTAREI